MRPDSEGENLMDFGRLGGNLVANRRLEASKFP